MAAPAQRKQFALDSNVLFDLAEGKDFAHTFKEIAEERGYALRIPPTVVQELSHLAFEKKWDGFNACSCSPSEEAAQSMGHPVMDAKDPGGAGVEQEIAETTEVEREGSDSRVCGSACIFSKILSGHFWFAATDLFFSMNDMSGTEALAPSQGAGGVGGPEPKASAWAASALG